MDHDPARCSVILKSSWMPRPKTKWGCISEISSCINSKRMIISGCLILVLIIEAVWDVSCVPLHCHQRWTDIIKKTSVYPSLSLSLSLYLDRILKQDLNIYWLTRHWWRVTVTQLFLWNFQTHGYGRFWLSYDLAEYVLQRIKCYAQLNSSWIFFSVIQLRQILVLIFKISSRLTVLRNRDWFTKHMTHVNFLFNAVKKCYISMRN